MRTSLEQEMCRRVYTDKAGYLDEAADTALVSCGHPCAGLLARSALQLGKTTQQIHALYILFISDHLHHQRPAARLRHKQVLSRGF